MVMRDFVEHSIKELIEKTYSNETDVREEFVTPLLKILGYSYKKGEIKRGKRLRTPYHGGSKGQSLLGAGSLRAKSISRKP